MSRVIAAIDNCLAAGPVLAMARAVAPFFDAQVEAVHVLGDGDQTVRSTAEEAGVPLRILHGEPLEQIIGVVEARDVIAAVIGSHCHAVRRAVGHLPLALASRTDKPVIVVQPGARPPEQLERVLIAVEGTPAKTKELKRAVALIEAGGLDIRVVHVDEEADIPRFSDQVQHETEAYTYEFFSRFLPGIPHAELDLRIGLAADEILAAAEETGAELLAIGWPQTDLEDRGRVARELLDRSQVPVLLVATA